MERLWPIITVLGPLLLIGTVVWATLRNRAASRRNLDRAEQGARDLRHQLNREDTAEKAPE